MESEVASVVWFDRVIESGSFGLEDGKAIVGVDDIVRQLSVWMMMRPNPTMSRSSLMAHGGIVQQRRCRYARANLEAFAVARPLDMVGRPVG
jgi:hypothetical protein